MEVIRVDFWGFSGVKPAGSHGKRRDLDADTRSAGTGLLLALILAALFALEDGMSSITYSASTGDALRRFVFDGSFVNVSREICLGRATFITAHPIQDLRRCEAAPVF